jgi:CCR4-NOT transcriptional regulation complex NOT5 subunit
MFLINEHEKNKHIFFLENILSKLRNNHLSNEEHKELGEFYINYIKFNFPDVF